MIRQLGIGFVAAGCLLVTMLGVSSRASAADNGQFVWRQGFEKGLGGAATYFHGRGGEQSKLEVVTGDAPEGSHFLRETLAGKRTLEGFQLAADKLPAGGHVTVSAQVRGKGRMMLALYDGKWSYSEHFTLSSQWQTISLSHQLAKGSRTMSIYFLSPQKIQPGAVFEVDDIRVAVTPSEKALDALLATPPTVAVSRISKPPVIDGVGDDACWGQTVALRDFELFGSGIPASVGTTARLAYDQTNLYVLLRCQEPLLKTVDQRQSDVIAKVTQRDGPVLTDDSCLIFLQPDEKNPAVYEFTVNTLGTLLDAKMERSQLWKSRDVKWNSHAKVAVRREDGYWVEELAIPLADLGVSHIQAGDRWRVGLDRIAQSRHELSSWQPTRGDGAHAPVELGVLQFAAGAVAIDPAHGLTQLEPGKNSLTVDMDDPPAGGVNIVTGVTHAKSTDWQTSFTDQAGTLNHTFDVQLKGDVAAHWGVVSAADHQPIYWSPAINLSVRSSAVTLQFSTPGAYQIVVNDRPIARGAKADAKEVKVPLRQGVNVIAVRADAGTARLSMSDLRRFTDAWRMNSASAKDATSASLDDRQWTRATPGADGTLGQPGQARVFRRTILVDYTNVWPLPIPAWYIAGNSTQQVTFTANGIKGRQLDHWTMWLAAPKGLKVLGSTGHYGNYVASQPKFDFKPEGEAAIQGEVMPLYKIVADKPINAGKNARLRVIEVMMQIADPADAHEGKSWTLHYWSQSDDGTVIERPRSFEMRSLPALKGVQPKKFVLQLWGAAFGTMDSEPLRLATLATAKAAGFNQIVSGDAWTSEHGAKFGLGNQDDVNFQSWAINLQPWLAEHPDARLLNSSGQHSKQFMCMTLLLGKDWPVAGKLLAERVKRNKASVVQYDYEYGPFTGPHSCYCDRCLAAFREHIGLAPATKLTPDIIKDQYKAKWEDFMAWRVAKLFALMKQTVHEAAPGTQFSAYSGYQSPDTISRYGIDWRYVGQLKAVDIAGCGYGRSIERIDATKKALDGIPLILGRLLIPYSVDDLKPATVATRAVILRRALDATGGVLVYDRTTMDGRSWHGVAAVSRLISKYEDLFDARHNLEAVPGQDPADVTILKGEAESLLCVMNNHGDVRNYAFTLPAAMGSGQEFYTGAKVSAGGRIELKLSPGDARVYVLRP